MSTPEPSGELAPNLPKKVKKAHVEPQLDTLSTEYFDKLEFNFPIYATVRDRIGRVIIAGGGGPGRTGVPNKLGILKHRKGTVKRICLYDMADKAVMDMDCHPAHNLLACGVDDKCRIYNIGDRNFTLLEEIVTDFPKPESKTLDSASSSHKNQEQDPPSQKRVKFIPSGDCLATAGGDGFARLWVFPNMKIIREFRAHDTQQNSEATDMDVTNQMIVITCSKSCKIFSLKSGLLVKELVPSMAKFEFRDSRFCPFLSSTDSQEAYQDSLATLIDSNYLYTTETMREKSVKITILRKWDCFTWKCVTSKKLKFVGDHQTAFQISDDGSIIALGTAEGQLRILSTLTFSEQQRAQSHEFFVSDCIFIDDSKEGISKFTSENLKRRKRANKLDLISTSADNSVKCISIQMGPGIIAASLKFTFSAIILALILLGVMQVLVWYYPEQVKEVQDTTKSWLGPYYEPAYSIFNTTYNTCHRLLGQVIQYGSEMWHNRGEGSHTSPKTADSSHRHTTIKHEL